MVVVGWRFIRSQRRPAHGNALPCGGGIGDRDVIVASCIVYMSSGFTTLGTGHKPGVYWPFWSAGSKLIAMFRVLLALVVDMT